MINRQPRAYRSYAAAGILATLACISWLLVVSIRVSESPQAQALFSLFGAKSGSQEKDQSASTNPFQPLPQLGPQDTVRQPNRNSSTSSLQQARIHPAGNAWDGKSLSQQNLHPHANNPIMPQPNKIPLKAACPIQAKPFATSLSNQVLDECMIRPPENSTITVVFVHVGNDINHGMHTFYAIAQLRRTNPNADIVWILSRKVAEISSVEAVAECYAVNVIISEDLEKHQSTSDEFLAFRY